ncbi:MAG: hypothetical protein K2G38_03725 [Clostridia bacterium]|nr:hypothetical protein [Clostridia bacterium]
MITFEQYIQKFKECSIIASTVEPWEHKIINKNFDKMKKIVQKIYEQKNEQRFFEEIFSSNERCVQVWGASFSEIFDYDLRKSYEIFLEESKSSTAREIDIVGAKIAVERLEKKLNCENHNR